VAVIIPGRTTDKEFSQIKELLSLLKGVTTYPIVRRSNLQGAMDMGVLPDCYPGYQKIGTDTTSRFAGSWDAILPESPGLNALEMLAGIKTGKVSALYIMGDDPAGSDKGLKDILNKLEFLVVQDIFLTETAKLADVVLPACSWAEKSGTVTSLERRLQQVSRAEEPLGESKPDWDIIQTLAKKMGSSMHYATPADILKEIRSVVSLYADLAAGGIWPRERSPLAGADVDLSLWSDTVMKNEVITSDRLLFSSGTMIGRSGEISTLCRTKAEV